MFSLAISLQFLSLRPSSHCVKSVQIRSYFWSVLGHFSRGVCSSCLTSLLNMFWAIKQELFFMLILRKFAKLQRKKKKNSDGVFFCKVVVLQHPNLMKWSGFFAITGIMFWWIFHNSYYMESLQLIDKLCSSPLVIFLNIAYAYLCKS